MIPKKIHYCWFGGNPLTYSMKKCIKSWIEYCPDYEIIEWNESNFDVNSHPFTKAAYDAKAWAFVSDYVRLKVVYEYGGIYLDTDVELLKNIDFLLKNQCYLGVQQQGMLCNTGLGFGAEKSNSVIKKMLDKYTNLIFDADRKAEFACPILNDAVIRDIEYIDADEIVAINGVCVLPPRFLDPIAPADTENLFCEDTISIHHYSASWGKRSDRIKRRVCRTLGQHRVNAIKKFLRKQGRA